MTNAHSKKIWVYVLLFLLAGLAIYPILYTLVSSFRTPTDFAMSPSGVPKELTLDNYDFILGEGGLAGYFLNSFLLVPVALAFYLVVCIAAGFAFGKLRFPFRLTVFTGVLFLMIFPQMILAVQIFKLAAGWGLTNNYFGLILVWTAYFAPFGTYLMTTYYSSVPTELMESARIDGSNWFHEFFSITVPLLRQEIGVCLTVTVIAALAAFDIVYVSTGGGPGNATAVPGIQIYILAFTEQRIGPASALAVLLMVLVVIVILPIQQLTREDRK